MCLTSVLCVCVCVAYTYEQYQQHQEQLSLMHKQQLEQVQLQQQVGGSAATNASHVSIARPNAAPCPPPVADWTCPPPFSPPPEPGTHAGPGQSSVRRLGPHHRRPAARSENEGGFGPRRWSERCPLPLRYRGRPPVPLSVHRGFKLVCCGCLTTCLNTW